MKASLRDAKINTVCESAHCPNMGQCWEHDVMTFMILGDVCTRACRFCAVNTGHPKGVDDNEPENIAKAVKRLDLDYVVITSVTRDDLDDGGAGQFVRAIEEIKKVSPKTKVEVLVPDFLNEKESLKKVVLSNPDVIAHNLETVARLTPVIRNKADYQRSLDVLMTFKELDRTVLTKSGIMVGLGETFDEIKETMQDLLRCGCDILTIGQYLAPSRGDRHVAVKRFISPQEFEEYKELGQSMGFKYVMSGPLVRSSFLAEHGYRKSLEVTQLS